MIWWCPDCDNVFKDRVVNSYGDPYYAECPMGDCDGQLIHLDEMIYPTIRLLNKKGWITRYCCSGHIYGKIQQAYIYFEPKYVKELPSLPKGFVLDEKIDDPIIRSTNKNSSDNPLPIYRNASILYKWAKELPENPIFFN